MPACRRAGCARCGCAAPSRSCCRRAVGGVGGGGQAVCGSADVPDSGSAAAPVRPSHTHLRILIRLWALTDGSALPSSAARSTGGRGRGAAGLRSWRGPGIADCNATTGNGRPGGTQWPSTPVPAPGRAAAIRALAQPHSLVLHVLAALPPAAPRGLERRCRLCRRRRPLALLLPGGRRALLCLCHAAQRVVKQAQLLQPLLVVQYTLPPLFFIRVRGLCWLRHGGGRLMGKGDPARAGGSQAQPCLEAASRCASALCLLLACVRTLCASSHLHRRLSHLIVWLGSPHRTASPCAPAHSLPHRLAALACLWGARRLLPPAIAQHRSAAAMTAGPAAATAAAAAATAPPLVPPKLLTLVIPHIDGRLLLGRKLRGFGEGYWNGFGASWAEWGKAAGRKAAPARAATRPC